ncbi:MAG: hypothetical protein AAF378_04095 [Cyanobacteria bacterium P01_A01_bin.84]
MFIDELTPIFKKASMHPLSFMGGFVSGVLRLNLNEDPVRSWLSQQTGQTFPTDLHNEPKNGKSSGPQQISID